MVRRRYSFCLPYKPDWMTSLTVAGKSGLNEFFLRDIPYPPPLAELLDRLAEQLYHALLGLVQPDQHFEQRGFPRAIGTNEPYEIPLQNSEI